MQMNQATVLAILAFTTSTLATWDSYSYGNEIYARNAEPEYSDYDLYAREAEPEYEDEEEFSQLSARDEAYLQGYMRGIARRADDPLKKMAADDTKAAGALDKKAGDEKHKAEHDAQTAKLAKLSVATDQSQITALLAKLKEIEGKMKGDKATYEQKREKAHAEAKKAKDLKAKADAKKTEAKALTTRELLEAYLGVELDY